MTIASVKEIEQFRTNMTNLVNSTNLSLFEIITIVKEIESSLNALYDSVLQDSKKEEQQ